ncbi:hypothetical protein ACMH5Q_00715 [Aquirufa lenticrescens]
MENSGTYLLIAIGLAIYFYSKKKKTSPPKGVAKPRAAATSKPNTKKPSTKKGSKARQKGGLIAAAPKPSPTKSKGNQLEGGSNLSDFGLLTNLSSQSFGNGASISLESNQSPSPTVVPTGFDLEKEVKQLQARTGWDYPTALAYCQKSVEYHQKISSPIRLKKK